MVVAFAIKVGHARDIIDRVEETIPRAKLFPCGRDGVHGRGSIFGNWRRTATAIGFNCQQLLQDKCATYPCQPGRLRGGFFKMCGRWLSRLRHRLDGARPQHLGAVGDSGGHADGCVDGRKVKESRIINRESSWEVDRYIAFSTLGRRAPRKGKEAPYVRVGSPSKGFRRRTGQRGASPSRDYIWRVGYRVPQVPLRPPEHIRTGIRVRGAISHRPDTHGMIRDGGGGGASAGRRVGVSACRAAASPLGPSAPDPPSLPSSRASPARPKHRRYATVQIASLGSRTGSFLCSSPFFFR